MIPYYAERRYVLRKLATILQEACERGEPWLVEDDDTKRRVDEPTERRRYAAARALIRDFRTKGSK